MSGLEESRPRGRFSFRSPSANRCDVDPRLPHQLVRTFCDIDFRALAERGIVHSCLDVDNTLLPQTGEFVDPAVVRHLQEARANGWIKNLCVISNVIWKHGPRGARLDRICRSLDIPQYYGASFWTRKPSQHPFRWALEVMGSTPSDTAMVGDQIFADIVGGNRMGLYTILVKPMSADHWTTRFIGRRLREQLLLRYYSITR